MIVGKCQNPATGYGAAERRRNSDAPNGPLAGSDGTSAKTLVSQQKPYSQALLSLNRPDAFFLAHLIATAEQIPQTRALRRASVADALSYYKAVKEMDAPGGCLTAPCLSRKI